MTTINNKHVLITGGASGIGRRLALRCAETVSYTHLTMPTNREV